ncbi:MAG TPA: hypothetical protein V6D15_13205 [Oculatellaceae cyanobacterium]|jgi:hypothetical protein
MSKLIVCRVGLSPALLLIFWGLIGWVPNAIALPNNPTLNSFEVSHAGTHQKKNAGKSVIPLSVTPKLAAPTSLNPPKIEFTTVPPLNQVLPVNQPVTLSMQAVDQHGKPLKNVKIRSALFTPPKTPWFTTDFPIVEGTQLLDLEAIALNGKLQLQQVLPIRGNYQLIVDVQPLDGKSFQATRQIIQFSVPENSVKYRNFAILAVILLCAGLGGGWVIGGRQIIQSGEIAPQQVRLLLSGGILVAIASLLVVNISAEFAESHQHQHQAPHNQAKNQLSLPLNVQWLGDDSTHVGQLAAMGVQLTDPKTGKAVKDVDLKIKATQIEHNQTVFVYQGLSDVNGKLIWQQQFFDGAPHQVEIEVSPKVGASNKFQSFTFFKEIEVEGIAPPLMVRLISLGYFTAILVVGLLLGLWVRRDRVFLSLQAVDK